jgi:hypothetical protein
MRGWEQKRGAWARGAASFKPPAISDQHSTTPNAAVVAVGGSEIAGGIALMPERIGALLA